MLYVFSFLSTFVESICRFLLFLFNYVHLFDIITLCFSFSFKYSSENFPLEKMSKGSLLDISSGIMRTVKRLD